MPRTKSDGRGEVKDRKSDGRLKDNKGSGSSSAGGSRGGSGGSKGSR